MDTTIQIILWLLGALVILIGISIYKNWTLQSWINTFKNKPKDFPLTQTHHAEMKQITELMRKITIEERELILVNIFGRPIRVTKNIDNMGRVAFYSIIPIMENEIDFPRDIPTLDEMAQAEQQKKDKPSGVG